MHAGQLSLVEMLTCVPKVDQDQFQESGDGNVNIPLYILEKYMLPSLRTVRILRLVYSVSYNFKLTVL